MKQTTELNSFKPALTVRFPKVLALIVAISYGGGLWVNIQHELEGAHEANELSPLLHWLRDSSLALVFIFFGTLIALSFSRWLIQRFNGRISQLGQWALIAVVLGIFTGAAFAIGIPVHGYLFGAHVEEGSALVVDMLKDGSIAASINFVISVLMIFILGDLG